MMHVSSERRLASIWQSLAFGSMAATLVISSAFAGPPFRTDDPELVEFQHFEFNLLLPGTKTNGG